MVIYHLYEANNGSGAVGEFILEELIKTVTGVTNRKTVYYLIIGGILGAIIAIVSNIFVEKVAKIERLSEEFGKDIDLLLSLGEGSKLEFKLSFRWDVKEKRANKKH